MGPVEGQLRMYLMVRLSVWLCDVIQRCSLGGNEMGDLYHGTNDGYTCHLLSHHRQYTQGHQPVNWESVA